MTSFRKPVFDNGQLEFRVENGEVCIYGTANGLRSIANLILRLANNPKEGHIHVEDYQLLTDKSLPGAIAVFDNGR